MTPTSQTTSETKTALLAATASNRTGESLLLAGDRPVLAHQIAALRTAGISTFLIEVDSGPGSLLEMADRLTKSGCKVDFVRSASDLANKLADTATLIVQAEGVYIAPDLLLKLLEQPGHFTLTVDGRSENEAFERMDLNTRWAGLAVMPASSVLRIGELPEGYSMTSSLLRQAMQDGVTQRALNQSDLQTGRLRLVGSAIDAEKLAHEIMAVRASREPGFIETHLLSPFAAKIAATISRSSSRTAISDGGAIFMAFASVGMAGFGWVAGAAIASIAAIFANSVRLALGNGEAANGISHLVEPVTWLLLITALIMATTGDAYRVSEGLFGGSIVAGLTILARQLRLPDWAKKTLQSPALIALWMLCAAPFSGAAAAAQSLAALQLLLLIVAKWSHPTRS